MPWYARVVIDVASYQNGQPHRRSTIYIQRPGLYHMPCYIRVTLRRPRRVDTTHRHTHTHTGQHLPKAMRTRARAPAPSSDHSHHHDHHIIWYQNVILCGAYDQVYLSLSICMYVYIYIYIRTHTSLSLYIYIYIYIFPSQATG